MPKMFSQKNLSETTFTYTHWRKTLYV
ncbi:unnamed protein product [Larinioides sclopetarius]